MASIIATLHNKNILITGGTGFIGKVLIEKILRSIPNCGTIYLLTRAAHGLTAAQRVEKVIMKSEIFIRLRNERKDFDQFIRKKLVAIRGDLRQKNLGISPRNLALLFSSVNVIFHLAGIIDFNARIDVCVDLNVMGSLRCLELAKQCKQLGAFIHTSTAYVTSNIFNGEPVYIKEKLYPLTFDPEDILRRVEQNRNNIVEMERLTLTVIGDYPNTYTFTKAMTEALMVKHRGNVPLIIARPAIVGYIYDDNNYAVCNMIVYYKARLFVN